MACLHERIQSVNGVKSCLLCGSNLPSDFIPGKIATKAADAAESPEKGQETTKKATRKKVNK